MMLPGPVVATAISSTAAFLVAIRAVTGGRLHGHATGSRWRHHVLCRVAADKGVRRRRGLGHRVAAADADGGAASVDTDQGAHVTFRARATAASSVRCHHL